MKWERGILWFRNDLRLHDHEALQQALEHTKEVIPVYCIDPRHFGETAFGFAKTGSFRAKFLLESLADLRQRLRSKGSDLIIIHGKPEKALIEVAQKYGAGGVFAHQEVTDEEVSVEQELEKQLFAAGLGFELYWGSTLYHLSDLPMPIRSLPEIFTSFRKQVEKFAPVRECFPTPESIPSPAFDEVGEIPSLADLGLEDTIFDQRSVLAFSGGESAGFERLQTYFWENDCLRVYKETRNGLLGADYSSKFSAWLALGCLSPRKIYEEVKRYESLRKKNSSTYWMIFELIWRDYFRFVARRYGNAIFFSNGIKGYMPPQIPKVNHKRQLLHFEAWRDGRTGFPFVDANMKELAETGFMSNRGRQNVASFLVKDLGVDWRMGAEYFESQLVDYDVCSNYGNWIYVAGVGNDPRENRYFNVVSQAKRYDVKGEYVKYWLPELHDLPSQYVHEPWVAPQKELMRYGVSLGVDYPQPIVLRKGQSV
ncbi:MAG: DASH family cryptochrome [Bacteroidota bacterium]